jgi:hypothetical protein
MLCEVAAEGASGIPDLDHDSGAGLAQHQVSAHIMTRGMPLAVLMTRAESAVWCS